MLQLSLVGPPAEPKPPHGRERLRILIEDALETFLASRGLDRTDRRHAAELVMSRLVRDRLRGDARTTLMRLHGDTPSCWVCGYRIDNALDKDDDAAFSADHVVPRAEGWAKLGVTHLRPAHRLCNMIRTAQRLRPPTIERYAGFLRALSLRDRR